MTAKIDKEREYSYDEMFVPLEHIEMFLDGTYEKWLDDVSPARERMEEFLKNYMEEKDV